MFCCKLMHDFCFTFNSALLRARANFLFLKKYIYLNNQFTHSLTIDICLFNPFSNSIVLFLSSINATFLIYLCESAEHPKECHAVLLSYVWCYTRVLPIYGWRPTAPRVRSRIRELHVSTEREQQLELEHGR